MNRLLTYSIVVLGCFFLIALVAANSGNAGLIIFGGILSILLGSTLIALVLFRLNISYKEKFRLFLIKYDYFSTTKTHVFTRLVTFFLVMLLAMFSFILVIYFFLSPQDIYLYYALSFSFLFIIFVQLSKAILLGFSHVPKLKTQIITLLMVTFGMGVAPVFLT